MTARQYFLHFEDGRTHDLDAFTQVSFRNAELAAPVPERPAVVDIDIHFIVAGAKIGFHVIALP